MAATLYERKENVLQTHPEQELVFKGPFTDEVTANLKLTNPTSHTVLFKVKTTAPKQYCVRPNGGVLNAFQDVKIAVILQPDSFDSSYSQKHKFMVQSLIAPSKFKLDQVDKVWKQVSRADFMDIKLRTKFIDASSELKNKSNEPAEKTQPILSTENLLDELMQTNVFATAKLKDLPLMPNILTTSNGKDADMSSTENSNVVSKVTNSNRDEIGKMTQELEQMKAKIEKLESVNTNLEHQAQLAEKKVKELEEMKATSDQRAKLAEERARSKEHDFEEMKTSLERRVKLAEERVMELETEWVVSRDEIDMTERTLGEGGWGIVKVAKFRGIEVAAKMLYQEIQSDYYRELFIREMNMAARARHPNLVQFIGATIKGEMIILTEFLHTNLRSMLEKGGLTRDQNIPICLDICKALNYLHLMKPEPIVHRDVSSANVLLDPLPNNLWKAKLTDYGSVNILKQLKTEGPGNPTYSAPEASSPSKQSPKMDVFSFGILVIEIFSGKFPSPKARERLTLSIQDRNIRELIKKCTVYNVQERPTVAEVLTFLSHMWF